MSIKIQINSLQALERLLGGDSEIEVEVRNNIVQNFSKKHLKPIAEGAYAAYRPLAEAAIKEEIVKQIGTITPSYGPYHKSAIILKNEIREAIEKEIKNVISDTIHELIRDLAVDEIAKRHAERAVDLQLKDRINEEVRSKIDAIMKGLQ